MRFMHAAANGRQVLDDNDDARCAPSECMNQHSSSLCAHTYRMNARARERWWAMTANDDDGDDDDEEEEEVEVDWEKNESDTIQRPKRVYVFALLYGKSICM